jgi:hypothetical protein
MTLDDPITLIFMAVIAVMSVGRMTRFVVDDDHPWFIPLRGWYIRHAPGTWGELITCAFCTAPYFAAPVVLWAWLSDLHWSWWLVNGWLALSYGAAILNRRDVPA